MKLDERAGVEGCAEGFLELAPALYANDLRWIPEDARQTAGMFSAHNPWHQGRAARTFCVPGSVRAAAFHDPAIVIDGAPAAFFGYWESDGNLEAERAVLTRVAEFARSHGARKLYGPIQFNTALGYRVLLAAEPGAVPFVGEPYNPLWYGERLRQLGFSLERRYLTQRFGVAGAQQVHEVHLPAQRQLERDGFRFVPLHQSGWIERLDELHGLCDITMGGNFAYTPISRAQFGAAFGESMLRKLWPELSVVALDPKGGIAGFLHVYPDYGPLLTQMAGSSRVQPNALDYATHAPQLQGRRRVILKTMAVHPAVRSLGVGKALYGWACGQAVGRADDLFAALIREDNHSRRLSVGVGDDIRWYGLYGKNL